MLTPMPANEHDARSRPKLMGRRGQLVTQWQEEWWSPDKIDYCGRIELPDDSMIPVSYETPLGCLSGSSASLWYDARRELEMGFVLTRDTARHDPWRDKASWVTGPARGVRRRSEPVPPGPGDLRQEKVALATATPVEVCRVACRIPLAWTLTVCAQSPVP